MNRDGDVLRRNLASLAPTLTLFELALILECLGYELLGRERAESWMVLAASRDLFTYAVQRARVPPEIASGDCRP